MQTKFHLSYCVVQRKMGVSRVFCSFVGHVHALFSEVQAKEGGFRELFYSNS